MGKTMCEKILSKYVKDKNIKPGDYIWVEPDAVSTSVAGNLLGYFEKQDIKKLFDPERIYVTEDHCVPANDIEFANLHKDMRIFIEKFKIRNFFEIGSGVQHVIFPMHGLVSPGDLIAGSDSHTISHGAFNAASFAINEELAYLMCTGKVWLKVPESICIEFVGRLNKEGFCTGKDVALYLLNLLISECTNYKSIEFTGCGIESLSVLDRICVSNMCSELGAKFAIFQFDEITSFYLEDKILRVPNPVFPDSDACYKFIKKINLDLIEPYVACPHRPENACPISEIDSQRIRINQAFIGGCIIGIDDFYIAAEILKNRKINSSVRLIVTPPSQEIWKKCLHDGVWDILINANAIITNANCGACSGAHSGVLADNEVCISSSNRNYQGRMGSATSLIYLANTATVAASAVNGYISDPRLFL